MIWVLVQTLFFFARGHSSLESRQSRFCVVVSVIIGIAIVRRRRLGSRKSIRATGQIGALLETGREQRSLSTTTGKKRNER